jgi:HPt (histidine-containing phosphotransfer) domain-containing protein
MPRAAESTPPYNAAMGEDIYKVTVAKDIADLIPVFMANRKKELDNLRAALAAADFEQIRQVGHRMRGVGNSYGFELVSSLGKEIEEGARSGDKDSLAAHIAAYSDYLSKVQIAYE